MTKHLSHTSHSQTISIFLLGMAALSLSATPAFAGFIEVNDLDQGQGSIGGSSSVGLTLFGSTNVAIGEVFQIPTTGTLETITLDLAQSFSAVPQPLIVDFYSAAAGLPQSLLGTASIQWTDPAWATPFGGESFPTVDFLSQNIPLIAGQSYAYTLRVAIPTGSYFAYFSVNDSDANSNYLTAPDSQTFTNAGSRFQALFEVTAVAAPEPTSLALMLGAAAAFGLPRRSRAKR